MLAVPVAPLDPDADGPLRRDSLDPAARSRSLALSRSFLTCKYSAKRVSNGLDRPGTARLRAILCSLHPRERVHGFPSLVMTPHFTA